jgi:hypothetical protein
MAERNDADLARQEAATLLGLDTARPLCPADGLRIDLVLSLRRVVDAASETVLEGGSVDLSRLVNAVETLIRLLPANKLPEPHRKDNDPRETMLRTYMEMRARGAAAFQGYDGLVLKVKALEAELAQLKAETPAEPSPPAVPAPNVLTMSRQAAENAPAASAAPPPAASAPQYELRPADEPWRPFVEGGALHDRWGNHN